MLQKRVVLIEVDLGKMASDQGQEAKKLLDQAAANAVASFTGTLGGGGLLVSEEIDDKGAQAQRFGRGKVLIGQSSEGMPINGIWVRLSVEHKSSSIFKEEEDERI